MNHRDLLKWRYATPFEPIRMTLASGTVYEILRPELLVIGTTVTHVAIPESESSPLVARLVRIPNEEIVRVAQLHEAVTSPIQ